MDVGRLIVTSGLPGVGKTTLARHLAAELGAVYLRIDSVEHAITEAGVPAPIGPAGYLVAHAVAADNLVLGRTVVADCVNPWMLTRNAWRAVAERHGATCLEVEVICSNQAEHRRRVESRANDLHGSSLPTWKDVLARDYRPWERERIVVDTAGGDPDACTKSLLERFARA